MSGIPVIVLEWMPLPGDRAHVVAKDGDGCSVACGAIPREWLANVYEQGYQASMVLTVIDRCDHAGTYRDPRSVWTGKPAR